MCFERIVCIKVYLLRGMVRTVCAEEQRWGKGALGENKRGVFIRFLLNYIWGGMVVETVENVRGVCSVLFFDESFGFYERRRWRRGQWIEEKMIDCRAHKDVVVDEPLRSSILFRWVLLTLFSRRLHYSICLVG